MVGSELPQTIISVVILLLIFQHLVAPLAVNPEVFPLWERKQNYRVPRLKSAEELHDMFVRIVSNVRDRTTVRLTQGHGFEEIARFLNEEIRELTRIGFWRVSTDGTT